MVHEQLGLVLRKISKRAKETKRNENEINLIAVSKTYDAPEIKPVLEAGQKQFGENRVQEAQSKWPDLKNEFSDIKLHLIGPLQSNKAGEAVALFDVIHTIDREKIAAAVAKEMAKQNRQLELFIQVNTGHEPQKAGVLPEDLEAFANLCVDKYGLQIKGLMCIPPVKENPGPHFYLLRKYCDQLGFQSLSMGMSADYELAIEFGATHLRVGSAIFGARDYG